MSRKAPASKARKVRRKRGKLPPRDVSTYVPAGVLALCVVLSALQGSSLIGSIVYELSPWLGLGGLVAGGIQLGMRLWDRGAACGLLSFLLLAPAAGFLRDERPTPRHGPTLELRHVHVGLVPPTAELMAALADGMGPRVVSITFDQDAESTRAPELAGGFRPMAVTGVGARRLWVRELAPGSAPSSVRVGGCSLALAQVALPEIYRLHKRALRLSQIAGLPRRATGQPGVVLGHLGSAPTAHDLRPMLTALELRDARVGHTRLGTFPAFLGPLGLPLDPVLVHGWIAVRELASLPAPAGSPARIVRTVLELTEPRCAELPRRRPE
ncbi:MAG: hypothetical protein RL385_911 [Pseudomonadota bacterium]